MSVAVHAEHETELLNQHPQLQTIWAELDLPEGWRAEILEGTIVVSPAPAIRHNRIANALSRTLGSAIPSDWEIYQTQAVRIAPTGDIYIPDLVVYPVEHLPADVKELVISAELALLVVEITSPSSLNNDRVRKLRGYASGLAPLYLLVDPHATDGPHVTLYSMPENGVYQSMLRVPSGEAIMLPEPFDLKIDTESSPRP